MIFQFISKMALSVPSRSCCPLNREIRIFKTMRIVLLFILINLRLLVSATDDGSKKKLQIGIKKRIDNCNVRSKKGDALYVHYVGTLENGTEIDNSSKYEEPFLITLGYGQVIKGLEQGLMGMCAGEKRRLVIPSDLAYGSHGALPTVPPDATIIFVIELIKLVQKEVLSQSEEFVIRDDL